ncbi:NEFA-interacting nuclear protein isoform X2 [Carex rostrata]
MKSWPSLTVDVLPLFQILKENKDKKDAEFNERFKHRPPKALDEDETEFLDRYEESKREYEKHVADEEAEQLRNFQDALVAQASYVREIKETVPVPPKEDRPTTVKRPPPSRPVNVIISVKPQAKKAKISTDTEKYSSGNPPVKYDTSNEKDNSPKNTNGALGALVSYSDESDEDS